MRLTRSEQLFFMECVSDLLETEDVRLMDTFIQHADVSCLDHCLWVAYVSFWLCERLHFSVDKKSLIRGALLHDFFLYDWHRGNGRKGLHGFTHPRTALENAERRFPLTDRERDIILKHMWPLTPVLPRYRESYVVGLSDKVCSLMETLRLRRSGPPRLVSHMK